MSRKSLTKKRILSLIDKEPSEFGEALAKRHLKMIRKAVRKWAKKYKKPKKKK